MRLFLYGFIFVVCVVFGFIFFAGCTQTSSNNYNISTSTVNSSTSSTIASNAVHIAYPAFNPNALTVAVGATVTWTNTDAGISHTVTSTAGPANFASSLLAPGDTFSFQFTIAGTYEYHCTVHPTMTGTITVQ